MKLMNFAIVTHLIASLIGGAVVFFVTRFSSSGFILPVCIVGTFASVPIAFFSARQMKRGISQLEKAVATGNDNHLHKTNLVELDATAQQIRKYVQRWALAAERTRTQNQEMEWLVEELDSRKTKEKTGDAGVRLKQILAGFTSSADASLQQIEELVNDFQTTFKQHTAVLEDQSDAVSKTTTYVEQLSVNITAVPNFVSSAEQESTTVLKSAATVSDQVEVWISRIKKVLSDVESNEFRFRALVDHFREIGAIAETIGEISARTDMLGLNVSLEAVRAGQNARGFTVLAEEVRKLSEQTAQAAREVAGLVESIQYKTQESINGISDQRSKLGVAVEQSGEMLESVAQITDATTQTVKRLNDLSHSTGQQIKLTHDLIDSVERLAETSRDGRRRIESSSWGVGNLSNVADQLQRLFEPLRRSVLLPSDDRNSYQEVESEIQHDDPIPV